MKLRHVAALALVLGVIGMGCGGCEPDSASIKAQLAKDLPLGTRRDVVKKYLSDRKIDPYVSPGIPTDIWGQTECRADFLMTIVIQRHFVFDSDGKLKSVEVRTGRRGL
jgi:hypothetical protein